ncbi:hypothetical protein K432DRAFT_65138 [Lepidopterella palustris CBS 459.81]|uniref:Uncharacterized protein n=1 Tax=Lepidopterella palustris CBS 459.81 TaxID=1314670 RepID=A0A8E2E8T1_9PEZI|nr:hypothetical protein K432DRAFT_65138 [Lepidopterella palustris CBS 459.81]
MKTQFVPTYAEPGRQETSSPQKNVHLQPSHQSVLLTLVTPKLAPAAAAAKILPRLKNARSSAPKRATAAAGHRCAPVAVTSHPGIDLRQASHRSPSSQSSHPLPSSLPHPLTLPPPIQKISQDLLQTPQARVTSSRGPAYNPYFSRGVLLFLLPTRSRVR